MKYPGDLREFLHNPDSVLMGFPLVDNHRQPQLPGKTHLGPEGCLLSVSGNVLIVIVQADFADSPDFRVLSAQFSVFRQRRRVYLVGGIRMGAYGGVDVVIGPGQGIRPPGRFQRTARVHQQSDSLTGQACQQRLPILVKGPIIHVGMGIKEHRLLLLVK